MEHHIALKYCYIILGPYEGYENITETVINHSYVGCLSKCKDIFQHCPKPSRRATLTGCRVSVKCSSCRNVEAYMDSDGPSLLQRRFDTVGPNKTGVYYKEVFVCYLIEGVKVSPNFYQLLPPTRRNYCSEVQLCVTDSNNKVTYLQFSLKDRIPVTPRGIIIYLLSIIIR